ncbi:MAG: hypothetical protein JO054_09370 [Actinobacteria bacterium]|nr:hypothetical protein [Actinomycetota bacterium]MBV8958914.1 hypothetical protein [Actinomycetota bacterium]MBV9254427.1 hypothetical protein [Actinomycetota bacterium]
MFTDLLTVAVLALVGTRLVSVATQTARTAAMRQRVVTILRGLRLHHFLLVPVALTLVVTVATLLLRIPGLSFGWWTAIGGQGNPVIGVTDKTSGTPLEWLVPMLFVIVLIPILPLFAEREEVMFRQGAEHWSWPHRVYKCVQFGLVHALIGIPIGVALALSIGGAYFMTAYVRVYRRDGGEAALLESTRAHTAYNLSIAVLLFVYLVAVATGVAT